MKDEDPRKRKRLAAQVASGQLSLVKLRERIEGRVHREPPAAELEQVAAWPDDEDEGLPAPAMIPTGDDALLTAKAQFQRPSASCWRPPQRGFERSANRPIARTSPST